jgi:hypothetical protein
VVELDVFVSCGSEVEALRDIAGRVLRALEFSFLRGLRIPMTIRNWDYRDEPPEVVARGEFSSRSLRMLDSSQAVIAILGATIPPVTSEEILRAIGRYAVGEADNVWLFVAAATRGEVHSKYLRRIKRKTGMVVVYQEFDSETDLQEKLFVALIPYVVRKAILQRQTMVPIATGGAA